MNPVSPLLPLALLLTALFLTFAVAIALLRLYCHLVGTGVTLLTSGESFSFITIVPRLSPNHNG